MTLKIQAWVDGACSGNPGPMGAGVVLMSDNGHYKEISIPLGHGTNSIAELLAVKYALDTIKKKDAIIEIYTDSQYVVGLLENGWKAHANKELVEEIKNIEKEFNNIKIIKVNGHSNIEFNEKADELAKKACKS